MQRLRIDLMLRSVHETTSRFLTSFFALGACPRIENLLRKIPFGHFFRSFSLNSATIRLK